VIFWTLYALSVVHFLKMAYMEDFLKIMFISL